MRVPNHVDIEKIVGADDAAFGLNANGAVLAWGSNGLGQVRDGGTESTVMPWLVPGLSNVWAIWAIWAAGATVFAARGSSIAFEGNATDGDRLKSVKSRQDKRFEAAERGETVIVLIDDGGGRRVAAVEQQRLERRRLANAGLGRIHLMSTLTVLTETAGREYLPDKNSVRALYARLRGLDDGLPPLETTGPLDLPCWSQQGAASETSLRHFGEARFTQAHSRR